MLDGIEGTRLAQALAPATTVVIGTAFDLRRSPKPISRNALLSMLRVIQVRLDFTFLARHRSHAELFSRSDDPCGLSTNSASSL